MKSYVFQVEIHSENFNEILKYPVIILVAGYFFMFSYP
jgi:hypothetical protein